MESPHLQTCSLLCFLRKCSLNKNCALRKSNFQIIEKLTHVFTVYSLWNWRKKPKRLKLANRKRIVLHNDNVKPRTCLATSLKLLVSCWSSTSTSRSYRQDTEVHRTSRRRLIKVYFIQRKNYFYVTLIKQHNTLFLVFLLLVT